MKPKVSVVMPIYNRARVANNAIRSIIDQTFTNWELIIVDDGSTDGIERMVRDFANPKIKLHKLSHTGNISKNRNFGNQQALGDIIVVQDSDDVSMPDRLEEIVNTYEENPDADVVYHGMYLRFSDPYFNCWTRGIRAAVPFDKERLLHEQYIPGQISYKREAILEVPYNERVLICDDYIMLLELCLNGKKFVPCFKNLYEYVGSGDSVNVLGEIDGRRKEDVRNILDILKTKYGIDAHATLTKNIIGGDLIAQETI